MPALSYTLSPGDCIRRTAADLRSLLHVGGVSIAGLSKLLPTRAGLPSGVPSESSLRSQNLEAFNTMHKVLKLPLVDGGTFDWEVVDVSKALPAYVANSPQLREMYAAALQMHPPLLSRPWSAVVAFDEFAPGNKLQALDTTFSMSLP